MVWNKIKIFFTLLFISIKNLYTFKTFSYVQSYVNISHCVSTRSDCESIRQSNVIFYWTVHFLFSLHNIVLYFAPARSEYLNHVYMDLPSIMGLPSIMYVLFALQPPLYAYYLYLLYWQVPKTDTFMLLKNAMDKDRKRKYFLAQSQEEVIKKALKKLNVMSYFRISYGEYGHFSKVN